MNRLGWILVAVEQQAATAALDPLPITAPPPLRYLYHHQVGLLNCKVKICRLTNNLRYRVLHDVNVNFIRGRLWLWPVEIPSTQTLGWVGSNVFAINLFRSCKMSKFVLQSRLQLQSWKLNSVCHFVKIFLGLFLCFYLFLSLQYIFQKYFTLVRHHLCFQNLL